MKPTLENVWSGMLQRRLLPVAILLIAALVAIPFVLAKEPEPVSAPTGATGAGGDAQNAGGPADESLVALKADDENPQRRRVLGASKNPFQPGPAPKATPEPTPVGGPTQSAGGNEAGGEKPADVGGSAGGGSSAPSNPGFSVPGTPVAPESEPKTYELYSLTVRFGSSESETLERMNLPRLKALPDADEPVLVYLGPGKGAKTAIFMVDEGVEAQGDATCHPSPANCETLHMRVGDTEFLDVVDEDGNVSAQYQLDLLKIRTSTTADAATAAKARAKASKAGRSVLQARQAAAGPLRYRYDAKSGTVRKIGKKAYKAMLAKTAHAALGTAGGF